MFMEVFVNNALENGIQAFIAKHEGKEYSLSHEFELNIVDFLVHLYGKINILNPYKIKNDASLVNNFMIYGASREEIESLINLLGEYDTWLNGTTREKNDLVERIYAILAKLVVYKTSSMTVSDGEMRYYQDFFNLTNKRISQLVDMMAVSRENIVNSLNKAMEEHKRELEKPEPEPLLLPVDEYEKYGLDIEDVEKLPEEKIQLLNKEIKTRDENETNGGRTKDKPKQLVLSSGNGFVDALVLFSIMCTEIMVGIIVTVIIARF